MILACGHCLTSFEHPRPTKYCSTKCRWDANNRRRGLTCAECGNGMTRNRDSRPQGEAVCTPCRRARGLRYDVLRRARDTTSPGLNRRDRKLLLARWVRQGRSCAYCPRSAVAVDHSVPLARGGSNFEGNLVPVCKPCNSSKNSLLLVEWRSRKAVPHG